MRISRQQTDPYNFSQQSTATKTHSSNQDLHQNSQAQHPSLLSNSKISGSSSINDHLFISPLKHSLKDNDMEQEMQMLRVENELYRDKIGELEKWLSLIISNFCEDNQTSLKSIEHGLQKIDTLRVEKFNLKKALLLEVKKTKDLEAQYLELRRLFKHREEEILKDYEVGDLLLQKSSLEQTLRALSEEVEFLSKKNATLLKDLTKRDFFQDYSKVNEELEQLKEAHYELINTVQVISQNPSFQGGPNGAHAQTPLVNVAQSFSQMIKFKRKSSDDKQSVQTRASTQGNKKGSSLMNLITCNGGLSQRNPHVSLVQSKHTKMIYGDTPIKEKKEQYEAMLSQSDINFLSSLADQARINKANKGQQQIMNSSKSTSNPKETSFGDKEKLQQKRQAKNKEFLGKNL